MARPKKRVVARGEIPILSRDIPIFDPETEKSAADAGQYYEFLRELFGRGGIAVPAGALEERLSRVYQSCFKKRGGRDVSVVEDLAAHYPSIVMQAEWITGILRSPLLESFLDPQTGENRLLKALSIGFRPAAKPVGFKWRYRGMGRMVFPMIKAELESLVTEADLRGLKREGTDEARRRAKAIVQTKLQEFAKRYSHPGADWGEVAELLLQAKPSEAAKVITSRAFHIRKRDLEGMSKARRAAERILEKVPGPNKRPTAKYFLSIGGKQISAQAGEGQPTQAKV